MRRAGGLREDFHQRSEAARVVRRAGGLREDFPQRPEAARVVGRALDSNDLNYVDMTNTIEMYTTWEFQNFQSIFLNWIF